MLKGPSNGCQLEMWDADKCGYLRSFEGCYILLQTAGLCRTESEDPCQETLIDQNQMPRKR
jgi:hypothetical protein